MKGEVGKACGERACIKRGHHFIPEAFWTRAHPHPNADLDPVLGQVIGDFLVVALIGAGGFGKVYLGLQAPLYGLQGALKLMELDGYDEDITQALLNKFEGEAQALAALSHPNIVRLLKYGLHNQRPYLVMEYVDQGKTLGQLMHELSAQQRKLSLEAIRAIITQTAHALDAAHHKHIIHRAIAQ